MGRTKSEQPKLEKINIAELVEKAQGRFSKKTSHLADRLKTGDQITMSEDPSDYIISDEFNKFWKPLTGIMGLPFGRIIQFAGKADSGKSTAAMMAMKAAQLQGALVILWDAEGKFSSKRFKDKMGGDPSQILVATSRSILDGASQVVAYMKTIKEMNPVQKVLVVWDSVGASLNSAEDEENDDYSKQPGVTAKEVSWAIRRFNQLIEKFKDDDGKYTVAVLCINQVYANIGSVGFKQKGGAELEYLSSLILEMTRKANLTCTKQKQKVKYGITTIARVKKNHLFGGDDCIAELELVVSAAGIDLANEAKGKINDLDDIDDDEE